MAPAQQLCDFVSLLNFVKVKKSQLRELVPRSSGGAGVSRFQRFQVEHLNYRFVLSVSFCDRWVESCGSSYKIMWFFSSFEIGFSFFENFEWSPLFGIFFRKISHNCWAGAITGTRATNFIFNNLVRSYPVQGEGRAAMPLLTVKMVKPQNCVWTKFTEKSLSKR